MDKAIKSTCVFTLIKEVSEFWYDEALLALFLQPSWGQVQF